LQVEEDLERELAVHLEQLKKEYKAAGMGERDATDAARRAFGGVAITAEQCRDTRRVRFLEEFGKDLTYALRLLTKSPGFTATAVLSLALGVDANTATFGLVNSTVNSIRAAVGRVDRNVALFDIKTVDAQVTDNVRLERALAYLSIFFGMVAALLAGAGLFGVLAYSVAQRKREIGIRIAIGARPAEAALTVVRGVALFVFVGVAGGIAIALGLSSIIRRLLFGIQPNDPLTFAIAALAIWAIATLAALVPAAQAAKIEPASTLRSD